MTQKHTQALEAFNDRSHPNHAAIAEACLDEMNRQERDIDNDELRAMILNGQIKA
jgi:hypothetical protein